MLQDRDIDYELNLKKRCPCHKIPHNFTDLFPESIGNEGRGKNITTLSSFLGLKKNNEAFTGK